MASTDSPLGDWLALRESADAASRSQRLTAALARHLATRKKLSILDLATGAGSNLRYLIEHLPPVQHWTVVDRDPQLLWRLRLRTSEWAAARGYDVTPAGDDPEAFVINGPHLECVVRPLVRDLGSIDDERLFRGQQLVTASALLDLVSRGWLQTLANRCRDAGAAALFTITYDGRFPCAPADPEDDIVRELFNRHQRRDKGLGGPAAGPDAVAAAAAAFATAGYLVERERSDWMVEPDAGQLQRALIDGWASAATEVAPEIATQIANWRLRRLHYLAEGGSLLVVGHEDILALSTAAT